MQGGFSVQDAKDVTVARLRAYQRLMHFKPWGHPKSTSALFWEGEVKNCGKSDDEWVSKSSDLQQGSVKNCKNYADVPYGRSQVPALQIYPL